MKINTMKKLAQIGFCVMSLCIASPASSNELNEEVNIFCNKMKQCASKHLEGVPSDNAVKEMIDATLEQNCQAMKSDFAQLSKSSGLETEALSCIKSMNALVCQNLEDDFETPECKKLYELIQ
ncbi:hypothetical protein H2O73_12190 [Vibrio sp. 404]|uniref:Uncharacterized protein n=1 Tax=Vibrio marinisediminis TaxID=2758441 RepID=A0A7W2FRY5_9VIBR|nr:hypothetical protein [Vibrio marinisediminis]MBA5763112.1 hypothetical protein [Vibrio marinisediminis]